jgi:hypothetical protein
MLHGCNHSPASIPIGNGDSHRKTGLECKLQNDEKENRFGKWKVLLVPKIILHK